MKQLPRIMVAPNGARRTKADHPAIPLTISDIVACARDCHEAGAGGLHAHVRDENGMHVLDAGLYRELLAEMALAVPQMDVQITTEAVGRYAPDEQRRLVRDVMPAAVSVALREMLPDPSDTRAASEFYHWASEADIAVQHILYEPGELQRLIGFAGSGIVPDANLQLLFVLGRYTEGQQSRPEDLFPFLEVLDGAFPDRTNADWALCAFGVGETDCLAEAVRQGGKVRVGFENSLWHRNGSVATDNAERVRQVARSLPEPGGRGRA